MNKIMVTRGLPGSGKSTWAREQDAVRVNRDDIRMQLFGTYSGLSWDEEQIVTKVEESSVEAALKSGRDVVVDAMHLRMRYAKKWFGFSEDVEFVDFNATLDELLERNRTRTKPVPDSLIRDLYAKFVRKGELVAPPIRTPRERPRPFEQSDSDSKLKIVIVDIDGTIAYNNGHRSHYDYTKVLDDEPISDVIEIVDALYETYQVVYVSGRDESCRDDTLEWLQRKTPLWATDEELFMRHEGDGRADYLVKRDLLDEVTRAYPGRYIVGVIDDRPQVLDMWHDLGLTTFRVGDPTGKAF